MLKHEKLKIHTAFYKSDAIQFKNLSLHLNKFEKENLRISIGHWGKRITDGIILAAISKYVLNRPDLLKEIFILKQELVLSTILDIKKKTI